MDSISQIPPQEVDSTNILTMLSGWVYTPAVRVAVVVISLALVVVALKAVKSGRGKKGSGKRKTRLATGWGNSRLMTIILGLAAASGLILVAASFAQSDSPCPGQPYVVTESDVAEDELVANTVEEAVSQTSKDDPQLISKDEVKELKQKKTESAKLKKLEKRRWLKLAKSVEVEQFDNGKWAVTEVIECK